MMCSLVHCSFPALFRREVEGRRTKGWLEKFSEVVRHFKSYFVRGLLGTGPADPTLESASPSPPQASIWHRNRAKSGNRCRIDAESMPNRPLRRGGQGGFEGAVQGPVPKRPLSILFRMVEVPRSAEKCSEPFCLSPLPSTPPANYIYQKRPNAEGSHVSVVFQQSPLKVIYVITDALPCFVNVLTCSCRQRNPCKSHFLGGHCNISKTEICKTEVWLGDGEMTIKIKFALLRGLWAWGWRGELP